MTMGVGIDQLNTLEKVFLPDGGQKSDGEMTESNPHVQDMTPTDTGLGQNNSEKAAEKPTSPTKTPTAKQPIRNLSLLLERPNVEWIQVVRAKKVRVTANLVGDKKDSKNYVVGDDERGGCIVIMHLSDNPMGVGDDAFYDCPPQGE